MKKYRVSAESCCCVCTGKDECCATDDIPEEHVYTNLVSGKLYAFVHDSAECGGLMEVEEANPHP